MWWRAHPVSVLMFIALAAPIAPFLPLMSAEALTFDEVVAAIEETPAVTEARLARQAAEQRFELLSFVGDIGITISPTTELTTAEESSFADRTSYGIGVSADIPLGLSPAAKVARMRHRMRWNGRCLPSGRLARRDGRIC
jgi:hypothetical protein